MQIELVNNVSLNCTSAVLFLGEYTKKGYITV